MGDNNKLPVNWQPLWSLFVVTVPPVFILFAKWGLFSYWITPETADAQAKAFINAVQDVLVILLPIISAAYIWWKSTRTQQILAVKELPGVLGVAVTPRVDAKIADPLVTTPEKLLLEISQKAIDTGMQRINPTTPPPSTRPK